MAKNAVIAAIPAAFEKTYLIIHNPKTRRWGFPGALFSEGKTPIAGLLKIADDLGGFEIKSAKLETSADHLYAGKLGTVLYYKLELLNIEDIRALALSGNRLQDFLNPFEILHLPNLSRHTKFFCNMKVYS